MRAYTQVRFIVSILSALESLRSTSWFPLKWRRRRAHEFVQKADLALETGDSQRAAELLGSSLEWVPDPAVRVRLGRMHYESDDLPAAERLFRAALAEETTNADALKGLAFTLHKKGHLQEALYFYLRVLRHQEKDRNALVNVGGILYALGQYEQALEYYEEAARDQ